MAYNPLLIRHYLDPAGMNGMDSIKAFESRRFYKDFPYFTELPNPMDSWYDKLYFGRVDRFQNGIVVSEETINSRLVQLKDSKNIFVLDFVADAFHDLQRHLRAASDSGYINNAGTRFNKLKPIRGWQNYKNQFADTRDFLYDIFFSYLRSNTAASSRIVNFGTFLIEFINYLETKPTNVPTTLSGFVVSNTSHPMVSGLSIELFQGDHGSDTPKVREYMLDPNFDYYVRAARKYGFYVHKNAPWKLTADVLSNPMLEYLVEYGVSKANFFSHYYDRTYTLDMEQLKTDLLGMYNRYAEAFPLIRETHPAYVNSLEPGNPRLCSSTHVTFQNRLTMSRPAMEAQFNDGYWIDFYCRLRFREKDLYIKNVRSIILEGIQRAQVYGFESGIKHINDAVKPYLYQNY
tara:strand:+ start:620 stop:1831 length:1212 start_codon:yes stop_codon:yes gene_type:complete